MMLPRPGTADHAALVTHDRHPGIQTALAWLAFSHLPEELQSVGEPLYGAAVELIERIPTDSAELTNALNTLVEAKDWFVRATIRNDHGRPGPIARPTEVVDPPEDLVETAIRHIEQGQELWRRPTSLADSPEPGTGRTEGWPAA